MLIISKGRKEGRGEGGEEMLAAEGKSRSLAKAYFWLQT